MLTRGFPAALSFVLLLCGRLEAGAPTEELRGLFASAAAALSDPARAEPEERLTAVRRIVARIVDFPVAAQLSLGQAWPARSAAEREEFVHLFGSVLTTSFVSRFAAMARTHGGLHVRYLGEDVAGSVATVRTAIGSRTGSETAVEYAMARRGDRWLVRDVVIDGVSVVGNYRAQLSRILASSSYGELVSRMRARLGVPGTAARDTKEALGADTAEPPAVVERVRGETAGPPGEMRGAAKPEPAPVEVRPVEVKPVDVKPIEARPAEVKAAAVAPPKPAVALRTRATVYWVQVGSLRSAEAAGRLEARVRRELPSARTYMTPGAAPSGEKLIRVRVGPYASRSEAASVMTKLQGRGYKPFIAE